MSASKLSEAGGQSRRKPSRIPSASASLLAVLQTLGAAVSADPLDAWELTHPLPPGVTLNAVGYGNGQWIGVGYFGTIASSADGLNWAVRSSGTSHDLTGVSYGNGLWTAVGAQRLVFTPSIGWTSGDPESSGVILTSRDGLVWTERTLTTVAFLNGVAHGDGVWAAVGLGSLATSPDGAHWNVQPGGWTIRSCVGYGNGRWQTAIWNRTRLETSIFTSDAPGGPGGRSPHIATNYLSGIAYGDGHWVAVGEDGTILASPNGFSWIRRPSPTRSFLMGVGFGDGLWIAVAEDGSLLTAGRTRSRPKLSIDTSGASIVLRWHSDASGVALESTSDLTDTAGWTPVSLRPEAVGTQNTLIETTASPARFYRLRRP